PPDNWFSAYLCASMYARSRAFIRDWYPAPCFRNHSITSVSMRIESSAFFGTGFRPFRATARANISGVHSGASTSRPMSPSMVLRTFDSLVDDVREVEARFMFRGLTNRNYTDVVTALGMRNRYDLIVKETKSQKTPLAVRFTRILGGQSNPPKNPLRVREVDTVLAQIGTTFRLVPR